jgi:hypothetical protein
MNFLVFLLYKIETKDYLVFFVSKCGKNHVTQYYYDTKKSLVFFLNINDT